MELHVKLTGKDQVTLVESLTGFQKMLRQTGRLSGKGVGYVPPILLNPPSGVYDQPASDAVLSEHSFIP